MGSESLMHSYPQLTDGLPTIIHRHAQTLYVVFWSLDCPRPHQRSGRQV